MISDLLTDLNDAQKKAVISDNRACLVLAGPGSGKTHTITSRIRYLIHERGVLPESILVITFTKEAALSMQDRFIRAERYNLPVVFGTFHSIFFMFLRSYAGISPQKLLSESYKKTLLSDIITKTDVNAEAPFKEEKSTEFISGFISAMHYYKNTLDKKKASAFLAPAYLNMFEPVLFKYEEIRKSKGLCDFDDMVYDCRKLLSDDACIKKKLQDRFSHILIDEYQDINRVQFETIDLLRSGSNSLFAVGDDDQSIYGFRGSDPENMKIFKSRYNAEVINLTENYRSLPHIIESAGKVISENKNRFSKTQYSARIQGRCSQTLIRSFESSEDEYEELLKNIRKTGFGDIAVLFRTNLKMQGFASFLSRKGQRYSIKERSICIYEHPAALDLFAYLECSVDIYSDMIYRIINKPVRFISSEALCCFKEYDPLRSAITYYEESSEKGKRYRIESVKELKRDLEFMRGKSLYLMICLIRKKAGLDKYYRDHFKYAPNLLGEYNAVLDFLSEDSLNYTDLKDWRQFIEGYKNDYLKNCPIENKLLKSENRSVTAKEEKIPKLMTFHASKGLEFETVLIPDLNEGNLPHIRDDKNVTGQYIEEERRLFYVGMTRAKDELFISYIQNKNNPRHGPSRFLNCLLHN